MKKIITIGRELGSGGRTIGKMVANQLGIPYYDRELIDEAAKKSGLTTKYIETAEQKVTSSLLYNIAMGTSYGYGILETANNQSLPLSEQIYIAQQQIIKELAKKGSCVIVGRCADAILDNSFDVLKVFIYADTKERIKRCVTKYNMTADIAKKQIKQSDKARSNHYNIYTDKEWGNRHNYDLMLNSSALGYQKCANAICSVVCE